MKYTIQCTLFYYIIANLRGERKIFGAMSGNFPCRVLTVILKQFDSMNFLWTSVH